MSLNNFEDFAVDSSYLWYENRDAFNEYWFLDKNYGARIHTSFRMGNIGVEDTEEILLQKSRLHFRLLARRLSDDLEDAEKLFIYKANCYLSDNEIIRLHSSMGRYGNCKLLVVMRSDIGDSSTRKLNNALHVGFISRYWDGAREMTISLKEWVDVINWSLNEFEIDCK